VDSTRYSPMCSLVCLGGQRVRFCLQANGCPQANGLRFLSPGQGVLAAALGTTSEQKTCRLKACDCQNVPTGLRKPVNRSPSGCLFVMACFPGRRRSTGLPWAKKSQACGLKTWPCNSPTRHRMNGQSSSSACAVLPCGIKNAARTGAGMGTFGPRTECQITSLRSKSSTASAFVRSKCSETAAP
jgi:hypothetical protein